MECHCWQTISRETGLTLRTFKVAWPNLEVTVSSRRTKAKRPPVGSQVHHSREGTVTQLRQRAAWPGKRLEAQDPVLVVEG